MPCDGFSALWSVIADKDDGLLLLDWQDGSRRESTYFPAHHSRRFERMLAYHVEHGNDPKVGLVPRRDRHLDGLAESTVLWASVENPIAVRGLQAFRPQPTLIFKTGRALRCLWWLDKPLPMKADPDQDYLTRGNKRLAFALKANSRHADPSWLMPVGELVHADPDARYTARLVVGKLRDAPVRRLKPVSAR